MSWETVVYEITPISYAQCGLYRQFHRREEDIYSNIDSLYRKRYGKESTPSKCAQQVPCERTLTNYAGCPILNASFAFRVGIAQPSPFVLSPPCHLRCRH